MVSVVVNANLWRCFDYLWDGEFGEPAIAQRVRVPFGRGDRLTVGFVTETTRPVGQRKLKRVAELIDAEPQLNETLWRLGQWMHEYYLSPLGMTLAGMIPSAVGRVRPRREAVVFLTSKRSESGSSLGPRQRRILDELLEAKKQGVEPIALERLLHHSGATRDSIRRLATRKLIRMESRPVRLSELSGEQCGDPFELNDDQREVLSALKGKLEGGFSCTLLYGVTGSGKTEVYVRAIREVIASGKQAIVLAPEIALATQTLQRFLKRLPKVAVLHSGLTDAQRAFYYEQIRDGWASVIVGPRSAVFAPARKLGLIIVDEEHEPSYKQDTSPRYHGRDVAVKRASLEDIPIVLGTATPSLESLQNVRTGRYEMLRLPRRVANLPLPPLQIVSLRKDLRRGRIELLGRTMTLKIAAALDRDKQIILLMNRRGYASYVFCPSCEWRMTCRNCSRSMVFHQAMQLAMCHYCSHTDPLPDACPACGRKIVLFGYGIQRIENELGRKFPEARVARMDSDTMTSPKQFSKVLDAFAAGELDILLGTQMVAKGLDFPKVSLVGVVSGDTSLTIPDFRASERTFQLIVQVAGRSGRSAAQSGPGEVVVQTLHEDEPSIQFASNHDFDGFAKWELPLRKEARLPPFSRLIRFITRHKKLDRAERAAEFLTVALRDIVGGGDVTILGPQPAPVRKIREMFRFQILLICATAGGVQRKLFGRMESLVKDTPAEIVVDVDPIHLL